ncbi:DNA helicase MCM8-like isoform X2 [Centruroides sculpturatus]|nr:DNA helicase MCM8-like isoform X2 [Centruroides sculpturatus]XP_023237197.1 DNA helicase MCM8-like isoform X2 [Centruroides sculpturatus]XP_023237198.1 DNA helicase MCM8-like isoform X2 [Centruroides sculpturatus]XP_023237199.1 DNA helicase MCM8-like isoform X2 [Centruroides sculpturatus]XP_023237200.1 DNA helicase MCM8-like isoform X2 [Centruroides sculpturatus]
MNRGQGGRRPFWNRRGGHPGSWKSYKKKNLPQNPGSSKDKLNTSNTSSIMQLLSVSNPSGNLKQTQVDTVDFSPQSGPYSGWKLYITNEEYKPNSETVKKLKLVETYCKTLKTEIGTDSIESKGSFIIEISQVLKDKSLNLEWPDIVDNIRDSPATVIEYFGLAMHHIITEEIKEELSVNLSFSEEINKSADSVQCNIPKIHARFVGFEPLTPLKQIKANSYGKFVSIKGTVVRVSNIKPYCTKLAFECKSCLVTQVVTQLDGKYTLPKKCVTKGCRSHQFLPLRDSKLTETVDWQKIRLQEIIVDEQREGGRVPRTIECKLLYDLVDSCVPGDVVTVSGIVNVMNTQDNNFQTNKDRCMFLLYISVNSIVNCRENNSSKTYSDNLSLVGIDLSAKDLSAINAIRSEDNLFRLFAASLCPTIYGHEMVKAGLVLGLIGGSQKFLNDDKKIPIRGDIHVLIVGDPGLGKSQMLQACANIAPRGVYVCGNTTTTSGLTVTLTKEGANGEYALEAGALVLADQGCCCIDEFDKMNNQHHALLEAMEQQTISIAKGGMVCSLPARTSILAAANPVGGHYNKAKTVSENIRLGSALLSRFDLVFILLDKPNEELDDKLSKHVIALHSGKSESSQQSSALSKASSQISFVSRLDCSSLDDKNFLEDRLKFQHGEICDPIPHQLLRKYVAYARKNIKPKLTHDAAKTLQNFYLELRKNHQTSDSTPITTRQLESMKRLTEARARVELRDQCTKQDALDIVELMKFSMIDTYSDQFGLLHFQRSQHGSGMSSNSKAKKFISALTAISQQTCSSSFTAKQMKQICKELNLQISDFDNFLFSLNNQGFLLKKGPNIYQLQTTDF